AGRHRTRKVGEAVDAFRIQQLARGQFPAVQDARLVYAVDVVVADATGRVRIARGRLVDLPLFVGLGDISFAGRINRHSRASGAVGKQQSGEEDWRQIAHAAAE